MAKTYGYARVSTKEQNLERQLHALLKAGVPPQNIVQEKESGKDFRRPQYQKLVRRLKPGDVLVVKSIDRMGRNYNEILEQWRSLTREKQVAVAVLDMPLLDTRRDRDLTGTLIADIVLQLLSYVAQTERENTRQRQKEGIAAAKARGVVFGRPRIPVPPEFEQLYKTWQSHELSSQQAARRLGVSNSTFFIWVRNYRKEKAGKQELLTENTVKS